MQFQTFLLRPVGMRSEINTLEKSKQPITIITERRRG